MMLVKVGRSAGRHCLRRDVGMGSRSEKELDDWEMILDTSSAETIEKALSMVGVHFGGIWGDEIEEEDFKAVCSLRILSEKKVANICDSDWEEASEGRRGVGLTRDWLKPFCLAPRVTTPCDLVLGARLLKIWSLLTWGLGQCFACRQSFLFEVNLVGYKLKLKLPKQNVHCSYYWCKPLLSVLFWV